MIGQTISHYKILQKLGEGGMGAVYLAEDLKMGRKVALKFLADDRAADPEARKRFVHEAKAQAMLSHSNITTFFEADEKDNKAFIVMEYVEGQPLSKLARSEKLPVSEILDITIQIGEGLQAAHRKEVVHRDVKPENVLVTPQRGVKITDFGLAKWKGASTITHSGTQMGTDHYMSPEQVEGRRVDYRTDIFSFGVILYELLCGRRPFEGDSKQAVFYELLHTEPHPLARYSSNVPVGLQEIVSKCLAKKPEERYQSAADLVTDLRRIKKNLDSGVSTPGKTAGRKKKVLAFAVPAAGLAIIVLLLIFKPLHISFDSEQSAEASQNTLAVMYFENIPDPEDKDHTGDMLTNLLTTSLSQLQGVEVISRERLYDVQQQMGKADMQKITPYLASKIATRAGVKTMVLGSLLQTRPQLIASYRLIDVKSGKILHSQRVSSFSPEQIFPLVDSLSFLVRNDLQISPALASQAKPVAEVTTSSLEAYRSYLEGVELLEKLYYSDAEAPLKRAIELDSNFAMAYFQLSLAFRRDDFRLTDFVGRAKAIEKAEALKDKVTERERLQIEAQYAFVIERNFVKAAEIYEKFLQKYPHEQSAYVHLRQVYQNSLAFDKSLQTIQKGIKYDSLDGDSWNNLAYEYAGMNRRKVALEAIDHYIKLSPGEPNPYDSKGDIYLMFGEIDSGLYWYQKAVNLRPDFFTAEKLGTAALLRQDYPAAQKFFQQLGSTADPIQKAQAENDLSLINAHRGQFSSARSQMHENLTSHLAQKLPSSIISSDYWTLVMLAYVAGDFSGMLEYAKKGALEIRKNPSDIIHGRHILAWALLKNGHSETAYQILDSLKKDLSRQGQGAFGPLWLGTVAGFLAFEEEKYAVELEQFQKVSRLLPRIQPPSFPYAVCLLKTGHVTEAVKELERLTWWLPMHGQTIEVYFFDPTTYWTTSSVKAHYWLGVAYEQQEEKSKAVQEYEKFLDIWKNADPGIAEVVEAKQRLAKLKGKV